MPSTTNTIQRLSEWLYATYKRAPYLPDQHVIVHRLMKTHKFNSMRHMSFTVSTMLAQWGTITTGYYKLKLDNMIHSPIPEKFKRLAIKEFSALNTGEVLEEKHWKEKGDGWNKMVKVTDAFMDKHNMYSDDCYTEIEALYYDHAFNH